MVDSNLNLHISYIVHKAHQRVNLILKCFQSRDRALLLRAYCTYVRLLLEYCTPVWSPLLSLLIKKSRRCSEIIHKVYEWFENYVIY